jgi:hypothetical protein
VQGRRVGVWVQGRRAGAGLGRCLFFWDGLGLRVDLVGFGGWLGAPVVTGRFRGGVWPTGAKFTHESLFKISHS